MIKSAGWILVTVALLCSCMKNGDSMDTAPVKQRVDQLENKLLELDYAQLFLYGDSKIVHHLIEAYSQEGTFAGLLADKERDPHALFLAYEILRRETNAEYDGDVSHVAAAYIYALNQTGSGQANRLRLNANLWGLLAYQEDAGELGSSLIRFGPSATDGLIESLNNSNAMLYEGSREATTGNMLNYEVRDFAAYYLSRIYQITFPYASTRAERNAQIQKLKEFENR